MPFRNRETLESWLAEFRDLGYPVAGSLRVMVQDGASGADTGLIGIHLANASTAVYIQPASAEPTRWLATMEPRDAAIALDTAELLALSGELAVVSALCGFLQAKSQAYTGIDLA